jgi:DNA-binding NtrC family response regulator
MPENLVESILFGHEKGSFTGAADRHIGKFVEAAGGTLFLDEIGELPPAAQVKLLRVVQDGEIEPVGARKPVKVDIRLISATNRDLIADVKAGRFREDLFYRLHVFPIAVPPLRGRPADIPLLARHFLARFAAEEGKCIRGIAPEAMRVLSAFHWPGNIRQLENAVFRAVVLAEADTLGLNEFPQIATQSARCAPDSQAADIRIEDAVEPPDTADPDEQIVTLDEEASFQPSVVPLASSDSVPLLDRMGDVRPLDEVESELIRYAISHYRGQMSEVARRLKIGRSTLYRKLDALGLNSEREEADSETVAAERQATKFV